VDAKDLITGLAKIKNKSSENSSLKSIASGAKSI